MPAVNLVQTGQAVLTEDPSCKSKKGDDSTFDEIVMAILAGDTVMPEPQNPNIVPQAGCSLPALGSTPSVNENGSKGTDVIRWEGLGYLPVAGEGEQATQPKAKGTPLVGVPMPGPVPVGLEIPELELGEHVIRTKEISQEAAGLSQGLQAVGAAGEEARDKADILPAADEAAITKPFTNPDTESRQESLVLNLNVGTGRGARDLLPPPQVKHEFYRLLHKVFEEVVLSKSEKGKTFQVKLVPEHLGAMVIRVTLDEGRLNTHIRVDNSGVIDLLNAQIGELRDSMANQGLNVGSIDVGLEQNPRQQSFEEIPRAGKHQAFEEDEIAIVEYAYSLGSGQVLDILA